MQSIDARTNASASGAAADISRGANGTVMNGGKATKGGWAEALGSQLANRYFASTLCSWCVCVLANPNAARCTYADWWVLCRHATGGEIPGVLPRLSDAELGVTQSTTNTGNVRSLTSAVQRGCGVFACFACFAHHMSVQMFEKFSNTDIDSAGRGGEYTVQVSGAFAHLRSG